MFDGILIELIACLEQLEDGPTANRARILGYALRGAMDMLNSRISGDPELDAFWARWGAAAKDPDYPEHEADFLNGWVLIMKRRGEACFGRTGDVQTWDQWLKKALEWAEENPRGDAVLVLGDFEI